LRIINDDAKSTHEIFGLAPQAQVVVAGWGNMQEVLDASGRDGRTNI
jgi:hypothetical protein